MRKMSETAMRTADGGRWRFYCSKCGVGVWGTKYWCRQQASNHNRWHGPGYKGYKYAAYFNIIY